MPTPQLDRIVMSSLVSPSRPVEGLRGNTRGLFVDMFMLLRGRGIGVDVDVGQLDRYGCTPRSIIVCLRETPVCHGRRLGRDVEVRFGRECWRRVVIRLRRGVRGCGEFGSVCLFHGCYKI